VTAQTVNNTAGSIRNLGDKALTVTATGALVNRDGVLGGKGNVDVTGAGIDNRGGTIGAEGKVTVVSGAEIRNGAGAIQAVGDVSVTAVGELQNALGKIRAVGAASQLSASAASVDNAGGRIVNAGAGPTVISAGSEVVNANADAVPDGGVIGGNGDVTVNAPTLRNVQGAQLQAGGVLALNTPAMVDNSGGKLTAGGVLSMKQGGAALINRDGEISGGQVDIGSASLDNTRGLIANPYGSGGAISIDTGLLTNAAGRIGSDHDLVIDATTLAGRGRIIGGRDAHVSLQGNYTNEADNLITANRDLTLSTTGVLTNAGTLAAAGNITLNAAGIANQSGALIASGSPDDLSAGQTTLNATNGDIDNAGRMEGNTVDSFSRSFSNRATVIGNVVTISADSITNDGPAAVIAGVDQVNLWAQGVLNNQNGGALFSLGDLNIAADGVIDDKGYLLHRTGVINNLSSTVEAGGALNVAADQVNNVRQDVRTETVLVGDQTATLTPLPWWTPRAPGVGTPERNSNTVRIDAYYLDPGAVISDTPVITPDGYVVHKAVVRLNANESAFQWMEGGLSYSLPDNGVDAQYGSQSRIAPQAGTQVMYYVGRLDQQSNPDQVKGQSAWSQFDKHQIRTSLGSIAYSSDYGNCATNCVRLDTLPGYKDPSLDLDMLTKRVRAGGTEAGVYPVEVQRTAHQTVTETRLLDSSGAPATITSGDAMRFNVGVRLNNDNGQIAAGGALLVNGTQTADGSDVQTISNTGTQLTRTYTFANRSGFGSARYEPSPVVEWVDWSNPSITQQIGVAGGTMTSNRAVILHAGKVSNNSIASAQGPAGASPVALGLGDGIAPYAGSAANRPVALGSAGNPAVDGVASVSGKPGGVAIAGAIRTVDGARAGALSPTLPASGLYRIAPQPEQRYLVETDPRFTSYRNFLSSDYLLERLGIDPQQARKRLGDGFYEQRQVLNQATGMSGQRYLAGYASAEEEYMALMSNGVAFAQEFKLVPGIALSDEQMAALTSDIVWLVDETVTLPDGSQQTVLAPQVYLARNASLTPTGALIAGDALDITAGDVDNRGSAMTARKQLHIDAGHDIDNTGGSIMGGDVRIHADNNLLGASVATSERTRSGKNESSLTSISAVSRITADGDLMLSAGQDLTLYGAQVNAGNDARLEAGGKLGIGGIATGAEYLQAGAGNAALPAAPGFDVIPGDAADSAYHAQSSHTVGTTMSAGGNLTVLGQGDIAIEGSQMSSGKDLLVAGMGRVAITDSTDSSSLHLAVRGKGFSASTDLDTQTAVGSSLRAGGNATVLAGVQQDAAGKLVISADSGAPAHDLLVRGSSIAAGVNPDGQGNAVLRATGNVSLTEAGTHFDSRLESRASSSNPVSDKSSHDISSLSADTTHGSMVSGNQVSIAAGGDLAIRGSAVAGSGDVALKAGGRVDITAARSSEREYRLTDSSQSGLSVGPASISMGSQQQRGEYSAERSMESQSRSIVGSSGGNLVIRAGRDVQVSGSDLVAGKAADDSSGASGNIAILAQNIGIDPGQDSERSTEMRQASQRGVSAALTGTPLDMVRNMNAIGDSGGSKAQKTKAGMEEISNSGATAPQVAISYSSAGSNSQVTRTYSVNMGSSVQAGGDILLKASGDGSQDAAGPSASGDIHITGSTVAAGGAVMLDAARDITVQASTDRLTQISTASERNRRFSLAAVSPGDAARSTSGSPNSGGVNQAPYNAASLNDNASAETSAQHASLITGDRVTLLSHGGDIIVSGSGIGAVHDINLKAQQGQILVEAGRNSEIRHEDRGVHAIGDLGSSRNGTASTVGVSTSHDSIDSAAQAQGPVRSQIVSTSGNVTLDAHGDITVRGSDLAAGRALALTGENIYLEPATDSGQGRESHEASQYGITVAAGGLAGTLMQGVNQALDAHAKSKDPRLAALYGAKTGLAMYNYAKAAEAVEAAQRAAQAAQAAGEAAQDVKPAAKPVLVKVTVSVGGGSSQSQAGSQVSANTGSRLTGIDRVSLTATGSGRKDESGLPADGDINAIGAHIGGGDITMVAARDIALLPAQDSVTRRGSNDSSSASIGVGFALGGEQNGFTVELAAASASGKANTDSATYQQTEVTAAGKLDMRSGRDTTLHGAEVRGDSVDMEVGRNLDIVSSQDKEVVLNRQHSAGVDLSICVPPICYGVPVTGSGNVAAADTDSDYLSVKEQSGVYAGKGGYRIDVEGNTHLGGAVIASAAEAEQNRLVTGTLSLGDLTNRAEYRSDNIAVSAGTSGSGSATVLPAVAGSNGAAGGVTYSAISPGSIVITDEAGQQALSGKSGAETVAGIRRDTGDANGAIARIFDQQKVQQQMEMARLVGEVGYQAVGIIGQKLHLAEGSLEKIALHAAVGYLQGQIAGGNGLITGLVAGGNEVLGTMVEDYLRQHTELTPGQRDAIEQWSALMTGGLLASAMSGNSANATGGAATALDGERYNRQLHPEIKPFISALAKEQDRFSEEELQAAARVVTANDRVADGTRRGYETEAAAAADGVDKVTRAPDGKYYETVSASPGAIAYVTTEMRTGPAAIQNEFNAAQLDRLKYDPKPWFDETQNSGVDILTNATLLGGNGAAPTVQGGGAVRRRAGSGVTNGAGEEIAGANSVRPSYLTSAEFAELPKTGTIDPRTIRYSQESAAAAFRSPHGTIDNFIQNLRTGEINPAVIDPVRIVERDGMIFTLDNRRLYSFEQAGIDIPYQKLDEIPKRELFKFTTPNDGTSIIVRGNRNGQ
jgi:filamentous hemagglutinin